MQEMESFILQLKQKTSFEDVPVLALECTWDKLLSEIDELLKQLGFVSFTYSVLTRNTINAGMADGPTQWLKGSDLVGSLPDRVVRAYYDEAVQHDSVWNNLPKITAPFIVENNGGGLANQFWSSHGINSRAYVPVTAEKGGTYWFHYFGLFHAKATEEFDEWFEGISEWLIPILNRYHALLQAVSEVEQNPIRKQELLSSTCLQIMKMTAAGMPVKRIADKLALTEEGITYHITRAKRVFGARNKTQLVAMMYEVGLF